MPGRKRRRAFAGTVGRDFRCGRPGRAARAESLGVQLGEEESDAPALHGQDVDISTKDQLGKLRLEKAAVTGDPLALEQPAIGVLAAGREVFEVLKITANPKVQGVVESGLGAQRVACLEMLLDAAALVLKMRTGSASVGDDAVAEAIRGASADLPLEEQLHWIGPSEIERIAQDLLQEFSAADRPIEHLRQADFHLQNGQAVGDVRSFVLRRERPEQGSVPAREEVLDVLGFRTVADLLHPVPTRTPPEAMIQVFDALATTRRFSLGPLVIVPTRSIAKGGVAAKLDERRVPLAVYDVEVVLVSAHRASVVVEVQRTPPALGPVLPAPCPLLGHADQDHPVRAVELIPVPLDDLVLALAFAEGDSGNFPRDVPARKPLLEVPGDLTERRRRKDAATAQSYRNRMTHPGGRNGVIWPFRYRRSTRCKLRIVGQSAPRARTTRRGQAVLSGLGAASERPSKPEARRLL